MTPTSTPEGHPGIASPPERGQAEPADGRFAMLDAGDAAQRQAWLDLWERWPDREFSAHPIYAEFFAAPDDRV
jgi:hypothetical protein